MRLPMIPRLALAALAVALVLAPSSESGQAQPAARNVRGIHTLAATRGAIDDQLTWARSLVGQDGYVAQPFLNVDRATLGPPPDAVYFVEQAYARGLNPILVLEGRFVNRDGCNATGYVGWLKPSPDETAGAYQAEADGYRRFVEGLPRVEGRTLYVEVWNEPNLHENWGGEASPAEYARFFADVSAAIRGIGDTRIKVLNAALAPEGDIDNLQFIADAIQAESRFAGSFDYWASHPYPRNQPPANNLHDGTAEPGSRYTIDAYRLELAALAEQGAQTADLQVILTETGYELGDAHYPGYSRISEELRAQYIQRALEEFWPLWPEVKAVTPFQLAGWYGSWRTFDWVWPSSTTSRHGLPTQPRLQYARLVPDMGIVVGTVQDDRGTPIGDASVTSEPDGYEARTLADGSFVLLARPGTYALTVARDGYESATAGQVAVIQGQSSRLGLSLPSRLSPTLRNASFEAADLQGWTSWGDVDGARDGPWFFGIGAQDGGRFLGTAVNCGAKDGGVQQAVAARPGAEVTLRAWTLTYRDGAAGIRNRVGIDPRGGREPGSASVVWSPWLETAGRWESLSVSARAESDRVTVFLEHDQDVQNPWNLSAFDGVELIQGP